MKTLKFIPSNEVRENVPNDIAAELVAKGEAVEVHAKYEVLGKRDPVIENRDPKTAK